MKPGLSRLWPAACIVLLLIAAGCSQPASPQPVLTTPAPATPPAVYIVYGSEKGDLSYTDSAYQGLSSAHRDFAVPIQEFVPSDFETLPALLNRTGSSERPSLIITVGFQYANFTRQLAGQYPAIRFLAVDQAGIGAGNLRSYEIASYGDSYLAGVLAASATTSGRVGIISGMQSDVLDAFRHGYTDGARAVNASIVMDHAYVHQYSTDGFTDPAAAGQIADGMWRNGTDVIFTCAGYSNTGAFDTARNTTGRHIIGADADQSPLGPTFVLASAVKRVDRAVYTSIGENLNGTFTGGDQIVGLKDGATGIVYNPKFASYNATVSAWESRAEQAEEEYLVSREPRGQV
jgi:basic membrane protein A and related proteins